MKQELVELLNEYEQEIEAHNQFLYSRTMRSILDENTQMIAAIQGLIKKPDYYEFRLWLQPKQKPKD